ncbi:MAG TPA: HAMP domain-containing sensor histidine kinase [Phycisphaerae bacterium]|nr:HAMP domain-containing sensor histidine kinase [Phycisphaerae bacterium]
MTASSAGGRLWPVLLALPVAVLVPTACVLWFMSAAMRNQNLAVRQQLTEAYRGRLLAAQKSLEELWAAKAAALDGVDPDAGAGRALAQLVALGVCDAAIVYDRQGRVAYPGTAQTAPGDGDDPEWSRARQLEQAGDFPAAAEAYATVGRAAGDAESAARALRAQARCLLQAGRKADAVTVLTALAGDGRYADAVDADGRFIVPSAELLLLELIGDSDRDRFAATLHSLRERLGDYRQPTMPADQRVFLMTEVLRIDPDRPLPTLRAEQLAREYLDSNPPRRLPGPLAGSRDGRFWTQASSDGRVVAVFTDATVQRIIEQRIPSQPPLTGARIVARHGPASGTEADPLLRLPVGEHMPGWQLSLHLTGPHPFDEAARRRNVVHAWTAAGGIAVIVALGLLVAAYTVRQVRLTRLKNDLIATVSHELKTPLASMRVLVDTLLDGRAGDSKQATEYLQLIARENVRLSRLIDNFLTFSRMERNKRAFDRGAVDVAGVLAEAVESVRERFSAPSCELSVDVPEELPIVEGDRDALLTVVLNLLDNAFKYTGDQKRVCLSAAARDGQVAISVADNGIGMTRRQQRRVFDRFYQADRRLSRSAEGCGLGLSIVKFIADAHGGTVEVSSSGEGSRFTVNLPIRG